MYTCRPLKEDEYAAAVELISTNLDVTMSELSNEQRQTMKDTYFQVANFQSWHGDSMFCITAGAFIDDQLVGTGTLHDDEESDLELIALFSDPEHFGKGLATQILSFLVKQGKEAGFSSVYTLCTEKFQQYFEEHSFTYDSDVTADDGQVFKKMRMALSQDAGADEVKEEEVQAAED